MRRLFTGIAVSMSLAMILGIAAGCGTTDPTTMDTAGPTTTGMTSTTTTGTATTTEVDSNMNAPGQLPVVKEKETLRVVINQSPHILDYSYGENKFTTYLQDETNVEIDFIMYPEGAWWSKLSIELSAESDLGDLVLLSGLEQMDRATLIYNSSKGAFVDLKDLINEYGHNLLEMMDTDDNAWKKITAPDGNVYALPQSGPQGINPNMYAMRHWIHSDFLEKYEEATGNGMPTTTDEYYDYLVWVRDHDVNGNGDTTDEVGWSGFEFHNMWYSRPTDFLMNAFSFQNADGYYQRDDVIRAAFVEEPYRDGLRYLNKLMEEGLMDEDYVNNDENSLQSIVALNEGYTVASGSWGGMHIAATDHRIRNLYTIVAPLEGPDGFRNAFYNYYESGVRLGPASVPASSEKPELAVAWIDACTTGETRLRGRYGEKGVDWEESEAGTIAVDGGPAIFREITGLLNFPLNQSYWFMTNPAMWDQYGPTTAEPQPAVNKNGIEIHDLNLSLYKAARLYENYVIPCAVPDFFFDLDTAIDVSDWKQTIEDLYRNGVTEFIYGTRNVNDDAEWAVYVTELEEAGLTRYLDAMQSEYDLVWVGSMPSVYTPFPQRT